jgi:hypothetical protein
VPAIAHALAEEHDGEERQHRKQRNQPHVLSHETVFGDGSLRAL